MGIVECLMTYNVSLYHWIVQNVNHTMKLVAQTDLDRDWQFQGNIHCNSSRIVYRYIDMIGN